MKATDNMAVIMDADGRSATIRNVRVYGPAPVKRSSSFANAEFVSRFTAQAVTNYIGSLSQDAHADARLQTIPREAVTKKSINRAFGLNKHWEDNALAQTLAKARRHL